MGEFLRAVFGTVAGAAAVAVGLGVLVKLMGQSQAKRQSSTSVARKSA